MSGEDIVGVIGCSVVVALVWRGIVYLFEDQGPRQ